MKQIHTKSLSADGQPRCYIIFYCYEAYRVVKCFKVGKRSSHHWYISLHLDTNNASQHWANPTIEKLSFFRRVFSTVKFICTVFFPSIFFSKISLIISSMRHINFFHMQSTNSTLDACYKEFLLWIVCSALSSFRRFYFDDFVSYQCISCVFLLFNFEEEYEAIEKMCINRATSRTEESLLEFESDWWPILIYITMWQCCRFLFETCTVSTSLLNSEAYMFFESNNIGYCFFVCVKMFRKKNIYGQ